MYMVDILAPQVSSWQGLGVHKQKQGGHPPLFGSHVMTNITLDHQLGCIEKHMGIPFHFSYSLGNNNDLIPVEATNLDNSS